MVLAYVWTIDTFVMVLLQTLDGKPASGGASMPYLFVHDRHDFTDVAAGPVLYSLPGRPAFPVRLTSEIFQRCQAHLLQLGNEPPYTVYDPCCGSAYLVVTLAYLHWPAIQQIVVSDID